MVVSVVGTGLIGGSIGLALRGLGTKVIGFEPSDEARAIALERGCIEEAVSLEDAAKADVVFVCVPPAHVVDTLDAVSRAKRPETVVTDCTSTKGAVNEWLLRMQNMNIVPGHPMAGHEKSGPKFASAWMFRGARWILAPERFTSKEAIKTVESLVKEMGAIPVRVDAEQHDREVALLSHLPHALAAVLVTMAESLDSTEASGGSWRDLTRVGGVDPELWTQILASNGPEVSTALAKFRWYLEKLQYALEEGKEDEVREFFERARKAKEKHS